METRLNPIDLGTAEPGWITPRTSRRMRSRLEVLAPGESVGEHVTSGREEVVVVLDGVAEVTVAGVKTAVVAPAAFYIGPEVVHDITNNGGSPLRYVYVVALHDDRAGSRAHDHRGGSPARDHT